MNNEHNSGVNGWKILALVLMVLLAGVICVFFVMRNGFAGFTGTSGETAEEASLLSSAEAETTEAEAPVQAQVQAGTQETAAATQETSAAAVQSTGTVTAAQGAQTYDIKMTFADGFHHTRVPDTTVYFKEGKNNVTGETILTLKTDETGNIRASLPAGDYTVIFGDKQYYDGLENITIGAPDGPGDDYISDSEKEYRFWKYLLPRQGENTICLVLEWKGTDDLDLCVFNARAKRYISAVQPQDENGGYLVEDDGSGSPGWEVVVIRDYTKSEVYTPYIRDGNSLMRGSLSAMEANGVRLSVLDHNGLLFSQEADPNEHAALWMPCYILNGKVIKDSVYEYDPAKYAWAAYTKY